MGRREGMGGLESGRPGGEGRAFGRLRGGRP